MISYLLEALPERRKAEMVAGVLQVLHLDGGRHGIPGRVRRRRQRLVVPRRGAATAAVPPALLLHRHCRGGGNGYGATGTTTV